MKKLILILIAFFSINIANAQWALQKMDSCEQLELNSVYFVNADTGYAVGGASGTLLIEYIYKTTDGGAHWVVQSTLTPLLEHRHLYSVYFINNNYGYVVGEEGRILKTTDGGTNWILQTTPVWFNDLFSVFFTDSITGCAVGSGRILKTTNGGNNWIQTSVGYNLKSIAFTTVNTAYIVGDTGVILKSTNAGSSWQALSSGTNQRLNSVSFVNQNIGFAVGDSGTILKTTDGGANWTLQTITGGYFYLNSVCFADSVTAYVIGYSTFGIPFLCKTTDCGLSWQTITIPSATQHLFLGVFFPTADIGYAVGSNASIFKYDTSLGIKDKEKTTEINIYPNPAKENIAIEGNFNTIQKLEIVNLLGQIVFTGYITQKTTIDISTFPSGVYMIKLINDNKILVRKFIKK